MTARMVVKLLPKQADFVAAEDCRELLYSGAYGAGKSRAVCVKVLRKAVVPGARVGLFRKVSVSLKATTLKTLLEPEGRLPAVLPPGYYEHNKTLGEIRIVGGGQITYGGLDDPLKIRSMNLSDVAVDEAIDLNAEDWRTLRSRIRVKPNPEWVNQIFGATNPGPPSHFLAERFGLAGGHRPAPNCRAIQTRSRDNTFLDPDYVADLETFTGLAKDRYVLGKWVGSDGLVYDLWSQALHVRGSDGGGARTIVGVDDGFTNPFAAVRCELDGDGRLHVAGMAYERGLQTDQKVEAVARLLDGVDPESVIVDEASPMLIKAMQSAGLPAVKTRKSKVSVFEGISMVHQRLADPGDGQVRLTVDPSCQSLVREFESYEWKQTAGARRDVPVPMNDHALDALRYVVSSIDRPQQSLRAGSVTVGGRPDDDASDTLPENVFDASREDPDWGF